MNIDIGDIIKRHSGPAGTSTIVSLAALAGIVYVELEPRVQNTARAEIDKILLAGDYAKGSDVKKLNKNVEESQKRIRDLERKQDRNNAKAEAERKSIKEKIDDTNQLIRDVLRMRRSNERP